MGGRGERAAGPADDLLLGDLQRLVLRVVVVVMSRDEGERKA